MMDEEKSQHFIPLRQENILSDQGDSNVDENGMPHEGARNGRYPEQDIERPTTFPSDSSTLHTDVDEITALERTQTSKSVRDRRQFEPIHSGDREELFRIASQISRSRTNTSKELERKDTLAGVNIGDPVLNPTSGSFDVYKWLRM